MASSVSFGLISYNTHLFFPDTLLPNWGPLFADSDRKVTINQQYLEQTAPYSKSNIIQLAALQEVWSSSFANDITRDVAKHGSYGNEFVENRNPILGLNPSGLILLADPACSFHDQTYFNYIIGCEVDGWDKQDAFTCKGYLSTNCDFYTDTQKKVSLGLLTTHMPTNYGDHPKSVTKCFQALADRVIKFRNNHPDYAVIVLGDFNVDKNSDKYSPLVNDILLSPGTGLTSAADQIDPGYSINPKTNTLWQHFNPDKKNEPPSIIDYFLYADSADGVSQKVVLNSFAVKIDDLTVQENGNVYNCSDHYPIQASITINVPD